MYKNKVTEQESGGVAWGEKGREVGCRAAEMEPHTHYTSHCHNPNNSLITYFLNATFIDITPLFFLQTFSTNP